MRARYRDLYECPHCLKAYEACRENVSQGYAQHCGCQPIKRPKPRPLNIKPVSNIFEAKPKKSRKLVLQTETPDTIVLIGGLK